MTIRACKSCGGWHDLAETWPEGCLGHFADRAVRAGGQIIRDIDPYQAVGGDVAAGGKPPKIGGRRQHREYLKRNGYIEVGNEVMRPQKPNYGPEVTEREVRQVYERLRDQR